MTVAQLKPMCKGSGLKQSGKKAELVDRLLEHEFGTTEEEEDEAEAEDDVDPKKAGDIVGGVNPENNDSANAVTATNRLDSDNDPSGSSPSSSSGSTRAFGDGSIADHLERRKKRQAAAAAAAAAAAEGTDGGGVQPPMGELEKVEWPLEEGRRPKKVELYIPKARGDLDERARLYGDDGELAGLFSRVVWPSGQALARLLTNSPDLVRGLDVVEVGCGLGLPSCAAVASGAASMLCVDVDGVVAATAAKSAALNHQQGGALALVGKEDDNTRTRRDKKGKKAKKNKRRNKRKDSYYKSTLGSGSGGGGDDVGANSTDTENRTTARSTTGTADEEKTAMVNISGAGLNWNEPETWPSAAFDVVLATDVLYSKEYPAPLAALLAAVLRPGAGMKDDNPCALIADPKQRVNRGLFREACATHGLVTNESDMPSDAAISIITVTRQLARD